MKRERPGAVDPMGRVKIPGRSFIERHAEALPMKAASARLVLGGVLASVAIAAFCVIRLVVGPVVACGNEVTARHVSPGGAWTAVVFLRGCNATTGFSTEVSILRNGARLPNRDGNVWGGRRGNNLKVVWITADSVLLSYYDSTSLHSAASALGVSVVHQPIVR